MFNLRPDQQDIFNRVIDAQIPLDNRTAVCASTGWGKSVVMADLARHYSEQGKTVLTVVHRDNLVKQLTSTYKHQGIDKLGFIKADMPTNVLAKVQMASVQTISRRKNKLDWLKPDVILVDEAHINSHAAIVKQMFTDLPDTYMIGLTATPMTKTVRYDVDEDKNRVSYNHRRGLAQFYNGDIIAPIPKQLMADGRLARDIYFTEKDAFNADDLKSLGINTFGEYNTRDLIRLMEKPGLMEGMIQFWEKYAQDRQTIVFTAGVEFSYKLAEKFRQAGYAAVAVSGDDPPTVRDKIYKDFEQKTIRLIINCAVLIEGFDVKSVECVMLTKPVRSLANYIQMVGRGLRSFPGKKNCYILDLGYNVPAHGFISELTYDDYRIDYKEVNGGGDAPVKTCPEEFELSPGYEFPKGTKVFTGCGATVHASLTHCPNCGFGFPVKVLETANTEDFLKLDPHNDPNCLENVRLGLDATYEDPIKEMKAFYQMKRKVAFKRKYKPTSPYAAFKHRYPDFQPHPGWNKNQLTLGASELGLYEFFLWIADWAFEAYDGEEVYSKFNWQVQLEFQQDCTNLENSIKSIAREAYRKARDNCRR